jgi:hypothetical protein
LLYFFQEKFDDAGGKILADIVVAMKARDDFKLSVLRMPACRARHAVPLRESEQGKKSSGVKPLLHEVKRESQTQDPPSQFEDGAPKFKPKKPKTHTWSAQGLQVQLL